MKNFLKILWGRKFLLVFTLVILGFGGYWVYFYANRNSKEEVQLKIEEAKLGDIDVVVNGSGQIQAESQVDLKPQIAGDGLDIEQVLVENDQLVKKGDLIAILDDEKAQENVRDAQLALYSAQIQYEETSKEFDNKTEEETWKRQLAQNTLQQKQNALNDALDELAEYKITAPFDGIVTGLDFEAGDSIAREEILASVITKSMQAEISLNEIDAAKVKKGDLAVLTLDVLDGETIQGEVLKIDTIGEVSSGVVSYDVVIGFESSNELLKPGMSVEVDITVESVANVLTLSSAAIKENQKGGEYVLVQSAGEKSERRNIETGITDEINVEIISGLKEGEIVVVGQSTKNLNNEKSQETKGLMPMGGGMGKPRK